MKSHVSCLHNPIIINGIVIINAANDRLSIRVSETRAGCHL